MKIPLLLYAVALSSAPVQVLGRAVPDTHCLQHESRCSELLPSDAQFYTHVSRLGRRKSLEERAFRFPSGGSNRGSTGSLSGSGGSPSPSNPGGSSGRGSPSNPGGPGFAEGSPSNPSGSSGRGSPSNPSGSGFAEGSPSNPGGTAPEGSLSNPGGTAPEGSLSNPGSTSENSAPPARPDSDSNDSDGTNSDKPQSGSSSSPDPPASSAPELKSSILEKEVSAERLKELRDDPLIRRTDDDHIAIALDAGKKAQAKFKATLEQHKPDKWQSVTWDLVLENYTMDRQPTTKSGKINDLGGDATISQDIKKLFKHMDVHDDIKKDVNFVVYKWRNQVTDLDSGYIQEGAYNPKLRAMFNMIAYRSRDKYKNEENKRLPISELRWQSWVKASTDQGKDPKDLKYFILHNITGDNGVAITNRIFKQKGIRDGQRKIVEIKPTDTDDYWTAMIGTDNIKGLLYMLADHHNVLHDKKLQKIVLEKGYNELTNVAVVIG